MNGIGSLLALGNKAGHIMIWHVGSPEAVQCVKSWKTASDNWIVRLSWSPWIVEGDFHTSILAYASADGVVQACKVKFNSTTPLDGIEVSEDVMNFPSQTLHPCTILRWRPVGIEVRSDAETIVPDVVASRDPATQLAYSSLRMSTNPTPSHSVKGIDCMFGFQRQTRLVYGDDRLQKLSQTSHGIPLERRFLCSSWMGSIVFYA